MITAHFGHWWSTLLYLVPVVGVVGWLSFQQWKENRRKGPEEPPAGEP